MVHTKAQLKTFFEKGQKNRTEAKTEINGSSSRSHVIVELKLHQHLRAEQTKISRWSLGEHKFCVRILP